MVLKITIGLWILLLAGMFGQVSSKVAGYAAARKKLIEKPLLADTDPRLMTILTLGHRGLYEDFLAIHALQYLVDPNLKRENSDVARNAMMAAARQGPRVESFYMLGCFIMDAEFAKPEWCEALSHAGIKALPTSWRIPLTQGYFFSFKLNDPVQAANWYALAASRPGVPTYVGSLAAKLAANNSLTVEDLEQSVRGMFDIPEGSRIREMIEKSKNRPRNTP